MAFEEVCAISGIALDAAYNFLAKYVEKLFGFRMSTAAQALNELLSKASKHRPGTDKVLEVVASQLDLETENAAEAAVLLHKLVRQVRHDIEASPHEEAEKKLLRQYISQFNGVESFAHVSMSVDNAKSNFLKADNLVGLTMIHMAVAATASVRPLDAETRKTLENLRDLRDELGSIPVPEAFRTILRKRLSQVIVALDHYSQFGPDELEAHLDALMGQLVQQASVVKTSEKPFYKKAARTVLDGLQGVKAANTAYDEVHALNQHIHDVISYFGN